MGLMVWALLLDKVFAGGERIKVEPITWVICRSIEGS